MKLVVILLFVIASIPSIVYGESQLISIQGSKYVASALIELRNSDGALVGMTKSDAGRYLQDQVVDKFLDLYPVLKNVELNDRIYELRQIVVTEEFTVDRYGFVSSLFLKINENESVEIFRGLHDAIQIKKGDVSTTYWTLLRLVD